MRNKKKSVEFVMLSETYSADLRGRQSVRTTFKLTPRSIDALSLLASQLGIKQKSIFDHLVDDTRALQALARDLENRAELVQERVPKTYVISRKRYASDTRLPGTRLWSSASNASCRLSKRKKRSTSTVKNCRPSSINL